MKKLLSIILCFVLVVFLVSCGSDSPFTDEQKTLQAALEDSVGMTWFGNVRNDVTELWRLSECATHNDITTYAVDYYKAYFTSDDEIHAVVNFSLNTTSKISVIGGSLFVDVHEYVSGEEHDASKLFGGMVLQSFIIDIESGEVEQTY